jgi:BASS family bile acid:Na+ symporter
MTPMLTRLLAGHMVPVDTAGLFFSTLKVVLAPLIIGLALNRYLPRTVHFILPIAPLISVITITLICASIIGGNSDRLKQSGAALLSAVFLLHAGGFGLGYLFARWLRVGMIDSRTIAIEVGMQNSGLGAALAQKHFPMMPDAALPCAISATDHSVIGSVLAGFWRWRSPRIKPATVPILSQPQRVP